MKDYAIIKFLTKLYNKTNTVIPSFFSFLYVLSTKSSLHVISMIAVSKRDNPMSQKCKISNTQE